MKVVNLSINADTCIKCGKCVKVCPSKIILQRSKDVPASVESPKGCISCGHCVAVCPTGSVLHSQFPADKVHPIDYTLYPSAEQMMLLCKARRSNRAFSTKPIPADTLDVILEAAHRAPTASNQQQVEFTLITDSEMIRLIADFTIGVFRSAAKKLSNPLMKPVLKRMMPDAYRYLPVFGRLINEHQKGNDPILRKATAIILIHTPKTNRFGSEDANLAYQNGSLMAETLGVSQFYMGFVCSAIKQEKKGSLAKLLGIEGTIHAGMALGMPLFRYPNYIDRKEIVVKKM
ncbi:MAG: nitroreductase family protein [Bacteroidetes bacterium]|nr:nitroreductase family protein [Bacteroidota bacterium]